MGEEEGESNIILTGTWYNKIDFFLTIIKPIIIDYIIEPLSLYLFVNTLKVMRLVNRSISRYIDSNIRRLLDFRQESEVTFTRNGSLGNGTIINVDQYDKKNGKLMIEHLLSKEHHIFF